jgi:mono/diheme cytochrome c family protein
MKRLTLWMLLLSFGMTGFSQMKVFQAPAYADTIHNPLKGNPAAIASGKATYKTFCTPCHGEKGKGDGVAAAGLPKAPADHTSALIQKQTDGALYWMIGTGNTPMPAYKGAMTDAQIWQLVSYIRTLAKPVKN